MGRGSCAYHGARGKAAEAALDGHQTAVVAVPGLAGRGCRQQQGTGLVTPSGHLMSFARTYKLDSVPIQYRGTPA